MNDKIKKGCYRHFKGNIYQVIGIATHTENMDELVIYKGNDNKIWARPVNMWNETVEHNGNTVLRFTYIGEEYKSRSFNEEN